MIAESMVIQLPIANRQMKHTDFHMGLEFECGMRRWRCTDLGTRTIIAICLEHDDDPSLYNGPPYAIAETVFDEYDLPGCHLSGQMPS